MIAANAGTWMSLNVIVTGAGSGIGLTCVRLLLDRGARIVGMDLNTTKLDEFGDRVVRMPLDISKSDACRDSVEQAERSLGHIDALIHFAAVWSGATWDRCDQNEWAKVIAVNLTGTFFLAQAVASRMMKRKKGSIVLTGSDSAKTGGVASGAAYVASKGGVLAMTRNFAAALGPSGIRVNAINPGVVETPMTEQWSADYKRDLISRTPLRRLAQPDDVAEVACFLASDQSRFITGEVIEVNGGHYFD